MEALISTPFKTSEIIAGKVVPYFFLALVSMIICVFVTVFIFGVPFRASLLVLLLSTSSFLFSALGLGLMISSLSKSQALSYQLAAVTAFFPSFILSGFLFEIFSMPKWIQYLTYIIPSRYFVQSLQTLFLVGNIWPLLISNIIPMLLIGVIFFTIAKIKTVKRLE